MPDTIPIIPTTIEMIGCHAVANEATAATPATVVNVLAAESVCCIIAVRASWVKVTESIKVQVFASCKSVHANHRWNFCC